MEPDKTHMHPCHVALIQIEHTDVTLDDAVFYWGYYRCMNDWCPHYSTPTYFSNTVRIR